MANMINNQLASSRIIEEVAKGCNFDAALNQRFRSGFLNDGADRRAVQAICYGTLRHLGYSKFVVNSLSRKQKSIKLRVQALLWVSIYQLAQNDTASYAVVNNAVTNARKFGNAGIAGFVNGILRNYLRHERELKTKSKSFDEAIFSYPLWWIEKVRSQYGGTSSKILMEGNRHPPLVLRVNSRVIGISEYEEKLQKIGLEARILGPTAIRLRQPVAVGKLPGFKDGLVSVQDFGAQKAAAMLDLKPGQNVLDACAAPGGKACHILEQSDVNLTAIEKNKNRIRLLADNMARLSLKASIVCADVCDLESWWDGKFFDRVLLDVPCTASGVVRRHPDIKWRRKPEELPAIVAQQSKILEAAWSVLRHGGKLLFVTCSIFKEENEDQVKAFLSRNHDAVEEKNLNTGQQLPSLNSDGFFYGLFSKN